MLAALDALSGYWKYPDYPAPRTNLRIRDFIEAYFDSGYHSYADRLVKLRHHMDHNFTPAYFELEHGHPELHLQLNTENDPILNARDFFRAFKRAGERFFADVYSHPRLQARMLQRLNDVEKGGAIGVRARRAKRRGPARANRPK
jgi:hypothetical protein